MLFSDVMALLASGFRSVFGWLHDFNIIGTISLLDILIASMVVDMIITALFVTFNVNLSDSWSTDENGNRTRTLRRSSGSAHIGR